MAVAMVAAAVAGGQPDKYPCSLGVYLYPYSISDPHIRIRPVPFGGHIRNIRMVSDINGYPPAENAWWAQTKSAGGMYTLTCALLFVHHSPSAFMVPPHLLNAPTAHGGF